MLDPKYVRENIEYIKKIAKDKKSSVNLEDFVDIYDNYKIHRSKIDEINAAKNIAAKNKDFELWKKLKDESVNLEKGFGELEEKFQNICYQIPNIYSPDTPLWNDDNDNIILRQVWEIKSFGFDVKEHSELAEARGFIDFETASKISGSRFAYIKWDLAKLQWSLHTWINMQLTDQHIVDKIISKYNLTWKVSNKPFELIIPPVFTRIDVMKKMARYAPNDQTYSWPEENIALVASAEHTLGPIFMDKILKENQLPIRYLGYSTAFRKEAWSYGKDVKWLIRQHQFDKIEMETWTLPENGIVEQEFLVACQEYILSSLWLPYQVMICCTGDMWDADYRHIDINTYMAGQGRYRETHSSDLMMDYQSRRLNTKFVKNDGNKWYICMNDATAAAMGRILVAIIEYYQNQDMTINIPEILKPYMGKDII